jgi:hypothetical protein
VLVLVDKDPVLITKQTSQTKVTKSTLYLQQTGDITEKKN